MLSRSVLIELIAATSDVFTTVVSDGKFPIRAESASNNAISPLRKSSGEISLLSLSGKSKSQSTFICASVNYFLCTAVVIKFDKYIKFFINHDSNPNENPVVNAPHPT